MAVYTHISEADLSDLLKRYDIGVATSFKGIAEGVENSNYFLSTRNAHGNNQRFILTIYEKRANPEELPYFLSLTNHLADKGVAAPRPVKDIDGQYLQQLCGKPACIISFLDGVSTDDPNIEQCGAVGTTLAKMHHALGDYTAERKNDLSLSGWRPLAEKIIDDADQVETGLVALIKNELAFLEQSWPLNLPTGTIHADLFPDNVLFLGNEVNGLIDFYFACDDILAYDIAVCFDSWCFDPSGSFIHARAKRMLEMYDAHRPLSPEEMAALPILCRGSSLRFLLTRLYDWLHQVEGAVVKVKDPREFAAHLRFHQTIRDTADYVV